MWILFARAPLPDAPYWPGRRVLAGIDAVAWPMAWIALALSVRDAAGIVAPVVIAVAVLAAIGRLHRALWANPQYHFAIWRWGRVLAALVVLGLTLKLLMAWPA